MDLPHAYHITFGTYGTRLHGDSRGTVDRRRNRLGDPIIGENHHWQRLDRAQMQFPPFVLSDAQRITAESALPIICGRGGWRLHTAAVQPDHVHVLLSAEQEGTAVRRWLKAWLGQAIKPHARLAGAPLWAEGGSVRWVWDQQYLDAAYAYINDLRCLKG